MKSEFEIIEKIRGQTFSKSIKTGIGDDCAVISKDSKTDLVITTDMLVEDIDFRLNWTIPEYLGHKALAISLSDIAAMGASPNWAMISIGVPEKIWKTDFIEKFYKGWFALAIKFNVNLIGGDLSRTPDKIVIDSIVAGEVEKNKAVLRSKAKPGDAIFVTGRLGGAAGGLKLLQSGEKFEISQHKNLLRRQLQPTPQTEIGRIIGEKNLATAMIDLSDGLSSDLNHICRESNVGAKIYADKIPIARNLKNLFESKNNQTKKDKKSQSSIKSSSPLTLALNGGEDFELLFTVSRKKNFQLEKSLAGKAISRIGEITSDADEIELITDSGKEILQPEGFQHF